MGGRRPQPFARGDDLLRQRLIQEAARIMAEDGVRDFAAAKRKAAARLNQSENHHLPSNREIEAALADYLQLFHARGTRAALRTQLEVAVETMRLLAGFEPRLTGTILNGVTTAAADVQIHAFPDTPEQVALVLREYAIPYTESDRRMRFGGDRQETVPSFRFVAGETPVEICVFPPQGLREAPLSPVDARPMRRASLREAQQLLLDSQL
jgi:hypothetical protein